MTEFTPTPTTSTARALTPQELARHNVELRQLVKQMRDLLGEWLVLDAANQSDVERLAQLRAKTLRHLGKVTPRKAKVCDHGGISAHSNSGSSSLFYCPKCRTHVRRDSVNTPR
jgi:tRNA(Ile2) C34 agmatinyltransferase TiaS